MNPAVQQATQKLDNRWSNARVTLGQSIGPYDHHGPDHILWEGIIDPRGVTAHNIHLQLAEVFFGNADVGQLANPCLDAVCHLTLLPYLLDQRARQIHPPCGIGGQGDILVISGHVNHILHRETSSIQGDHEFTTLRHSLRS